MNEYPTALLAMFALVVSRYPDMKENVKGVLDISEDDRLQSVAAIIEGHDVVLACSSESEKTAALMALALRSAKTEPTGIGKATILQGQHLIVHVQGRVATAIITAKAVFRTLVVHQWVLDSEDEDEFHDYALVLPVQFFDSMMNLYDEFPAYLTEEGRASIREAINHLPRRWNPHFQLEDPEEKKEPETEVKTSEGGWFASLFQKP